MLHMVFVKGVVVGQTVRELNIDGRIARFHQFQIHQQAAGATVTINERMDPFKLDMEAGQLGDDVFLAMTASSLQEPRPWM